ncbi:MAG: hypothetical protein J2P25_00425 [Nocardiopsaceae bacterium]|nr:hypothetical protein [Nocardiopsaceae bacterium]
MLDFTALDVATANHKLPGSVCGIGLVRVRNGEIVDKRGGPVRPPQGLDQFDERLSEYHGVTAGIAANAPAWPEVAEWIASYAGTDMLVSHGTDWDIRMMRAAWDAEGMQWPRLRFLCTLTLARRALELPFYRMPFVADACGVTLDGRHRPLINARGAALVAVALAQRQGTDSLDALAESLEVRLGSLEPGRYVRCAKRPALGTASPKARASGAAGRQPLTAPGANPDADPEHPFYGKVVVFTGALQSRGRQEAWNDVSEVGGIPERDVTKRTNILVVGDLNPNTLAPGAVLSRKANRAVELRRAGQEIEVMAEDDFLEHL